MRDDDGPDDGDALPHGDDAQADAFFASEVLGEDEAKPRCPRPKGDKEQWRDHEKKRGKKKGERKFSAATISRDIRAMGLTSLHMMGGVQYLNWVARVQPAAYLSFLGKMISRDDGAESGGVQFVVQKITIAPEPTAGVLTSPVAGHVQPLRLVNGADSDGDGRSPPGYRVAGAQGMAPVPDPHTAGN